MLRHALLAVVVMAAPAALGQTGALPLLNPMRQGQTVDGNTTAVGVPTATDRPAGGDDLDLGVFALDARYRPAPDAPGRLTFGTRVRHLTLETDSPILPERLFSGEAAVGYAPGTFDAFGRTWDSGVAAGLGFASSNAFNDGQGWYGLASVYGTTVLNREARETLTLGIDWNGNRPIFPDIPLPVIVYTTSIGQEWFFVLGLPLNQVTWRPDDRFSITAKLGGIVPSLEAEYKLAESWTLFGGYYSVVEPFHVADDDADRRLFYSGQRVEAGVRYAVGAGFFLEGAGGYTFSQEFERGFDVRDLDTVTELDNAAYVRLGVGLSF